MMDRRVDPKTDRETSAGPMPSSMALSDNIRVRHVPHGLRPLQRCKMPETYELNEDWGDVRMIMANPTLVDGPEGSFRLNGDELEVPGERSSQPGRCTQGQRLAARIHPRVALHGELERIAFLGKRCSKSVLEDDEPVVQCYVYPRHQLHRD